VAVSYPDVILLIRYGYNAREIGEAVGRSSSSMLRGVKKNCTKRQHERLLKNGRVRKGGKSGRPRANESKK